jgi:hypothetical protein
MIIFRSLIPLITVLFVLSGCGSHIEINPKFCETEAILTPPFEEPDFKIEKSIRTFSGRTYKDKIFLEKVLKDNDIACEDVARMSFKIYRTTLQAFLSALPFLSALTIEIQGKYFSNVTDKTTMSLMDGQGTGEIP